MDAKWEEPVDSWQATLANETQQVIGDSRQAMLDDEVRKNSGGGARIECVSRPLNIILFTL